MYRFGRVGQLRRGLTVSYGSQDFVGDRGRMCVFVRMNIPLFANNNRVEESDAARILNINSLSLKHPALNSDSTSVE